MRDGVVRRAVERLSAVEEHWILAAFAVVAVVSAVCWYMRSMMRWAGAPCVLPYPGIG